MLNKIKKDYDRLMQDDTIDTFIYVFDKKNNQMLCMNDDDALTKLSTPHTTYQLDLVTQLTNNLKNKIEKLYQTIEFDKVVLACTQTLLEKSSSTDAITKLLGILCDFFGGEFACLFERDYSTMMTNVNYKYHKTDEKLINKKYTDSFKISPDDEWTRYLREHDYAFLQTSTDIDETLKGSTYYQRFKKSTRENLLVVSLNDNNLILGGIEIDNITKNVQYINLIKTVSAFIVNHLHIKNANLTQLKNLIDLEHQNLLNSTMFECVKTLVEDDDVNVSMNELLEIITDFYGGDCTNIFYLKPNANLLIRQYSYGINQEVMQRTVQELPLNTINELYKNLDLGGVGYLSSFREMSDFLENSFPTAYDLFQRLNINSLILVPLITKDKVSGYMAIDNPKRNLNEVLLVKTMSTFVVNYITKNELLIKLERLSYTDSLTKLYNRNFYNNYVDEFCNNKVKSVGVIFADVNGLKKANDNFGHELGDKLIKWSAHFFTKNLDGLNFRIGGDEFVCIIENVSYEKFNEIVTNLKDKIIEFGEVHISMGVAWDEKNLNIEKIIADADENMYEHKKSYYEKQKYDERTVKSALEDFKASIENLTFD